MSTNQLNQPYTSVAHQEVGYFYAPYIPMTATGEEYTDKKLLYYTPDKEIQLISQFDMDKIETNNAKLEVIYINTKRATIHQKIFKVTVKNIGQIAIIEESVKNSRQITITEESVEYKVTSIADINEHTQLNEPMKELLKAYCNMA